SIKVRWPQNTNPAASERSETAAMAATASVTAPPVPPCATGTPMRNRPASARRGSTSAAPSLLASRWVADESSHAARSAGSVVMAMVLPLLGGDGSWLAGPSVRLELRVQVRLAEIVGEVAQRGEADAEYHFERTGIVEAGRLERGEFSILDSASAADHRAGESGDGIEPRIRHFGVGPQRVDHILGQPGLLVCDGSMAGDAEPAAMDRRGGDLHRLAFRQRQAAAGVDAGDSLIGFQRDRRIGQQANQVRDEAVGLLGLGDAFLGGLGGGFSGENRHA